MTTTRTPTEIITHIVANTTVSKTGCWEWTGFRGAKGYGRLVWTGDQLAHRVSYRVHKGEIPAGLCVCHTCDNPACVNPEHLWLGTHQDNAVDRWSKGRHCVNKARPQPRSDRTFSDMEVMDVRRRARNGTTQASLATEYGVNQSTISRVVTGARYPHLPVEV